MSPAALPRSQSIARGAPDDPALDWSALRAEGVRLLERSAGAEWTDFNVHDPGVTILEQLCFALTELGHRASLPIEDLLTGPDGRLAALGRSLLEPWKALPCAPATADDYRRLLIDRVEGLGNAWLEPRTDPAETGLYDIRLYAAPALPGVADGEPPAAARLLRRAARVFVRHRALCEDIGSIRLLRPVPLVVEAKVDLDSGARAEAVMAEIVYQLGRFLAPEPRRQTLAEQRRGRGWPEALDGPLPTRGFLGEGATEPQRIRVAPQEIAAEIAAVPGVRAVRHAAAAVPGRAAEADGAVTIGPDECFALDARLERETPPIELGMEGARVGVDPAAVRRLLAGRWQRHRSTEDVRSELRRAAPAPASCHRDIAAYTPLAHDFPRVYGVGRHRLSGSAPAERRAQADQLLGYLALFDRQMVDFLDRLAAVPRLMAGEETGADAFRRPLAEAVPEAASLLIDGGPDADSILGRAAFPSDSESRLVDFLLALAGEAPSVPRRPGAGAAEALREEIAAKRALLGRLALAARRRGSGLDYRARRRPGRIAGAELRARLLLGSYRLAGDARPRITLVEHVLLRPRCATSLPRRVRPLTVSAVVHLPGAAGEDRRWRGEVAALLRESLPAHVALDLHFPDAARWRRFRRLHRMWRVAVRQDYEEGVDWLSARLAALLEGWRPVR